MATLAVNIDQAPIDQQSDTANTVGSTLLTDLGTAGIVLAAGASSRIAGNGRMPYDPADPNFSGLIKVRNAQGTTTISAGGGTMSGAGSGGLLLLIFLGWLIFRKKG